MIYIVDYTFYMVEHKNNHTFHLYSYGFNILMISFDGCREIAFPTCSLHVSLHGLLFDNQDDINNHVGM